MNVTTTRATFRASVTWHESPANWFFAYCRDFECPTGEDDARISRRSAGRPTLDQPQTIEWPVTGLTPATTYRLTLSAGNDTFFFDPTAQDRHLPHRRSGAPAGRGPAVGHATAVTGLTPYAATLNADVIPGTTGGVEPADVGLLRVGRGRRVQPHDDARAAPRGRDASTPSPRRRTTSPPATRTSTARSRSVRGQRFLSAAGQFSDARRARLPEREHVPDRRDQPRGRDRLLPVGGRPLGRGDRGAAQRRPARAVSGGRTGNNHRFSSCSATPAAASRTISNSGNKLYLDKDGAAFGTTGKWKMSVTGLAGMHKGTFNETRVEWGGDDPLLSVGADASVELLDFPLAGQLTFTPNADGTSRLGLLVAMPVALGGITGETAVKVNPGGDLQFDRLRIEVGEVPIKGFSIGGLKFLYDRTEERWEGAGEVVLPTPTSISRRRVGRGDPRQVRQLQRLRRQPQPAHRLRRLPPEGRRPLRARPDPARRRHRAHGRTEGVRHRHLRPRRVVRPEPHRAAARHASCRAASPRS